MSNRPNNYALSVELARFAVERFGISSPQDIEIHQFDVRDVTHTDPAYTTGPMVWLGCRGEGRWLSNEEAQEVGRALLLVAEAQLKRLAQEGGAA